MEISVTITEQEQKVLEVSFKFYESYDHRKNQKPDVKLEELAERFAIRLAAKCVGRRAAKKASKLAVEYAANVSAKRGSRRFGKGFCDVLTRMVEDMEHPGDFGHK